MKKKRYPRRDLAAANAKAQETLGERLWAQTDRSGGESACWIWNGSVRAGSHGQGYGQIYTGYTPKGDPTSARVHRVSYELANGPIPEGLVIDHVCRNTRCVNPAHLRAVTPRVNGLENNLSPFARNARQPNCGVCGMPLSGTNLAMVPQVRKKTFRGNPSPPTVIYGRSCLNCYPNNWRHAVVPRPRPPGSRWKKTDPDYHLCPNKRRDVPAAGHSEEGGA